MSEKSLYRVKYFAKDSHFKVEATIHIITNNIGDALVVFSNNGFKSDGILSIENKGVINYDFDDEMIID